MSEHYKFFKESEIPNLQIKLVQMLDRAREYAGIPFYITSGFRTPKENTEAGGVDNSAHEKGLAVDLRCDTSEKRYKMITGLIAVGFNRIGVYERHLHADIDKMKPENVMWFSPKS